jgi:hypothetical protein
MARISSPAVPQFSETVRRSVPREADPRAGGKGFSLLDQFNLVALASTKATFSRGDIAVLIGILRHCDRAGFCYPGITRLTNLTGMSRRNVIRSIGRLEHVGLLSIGRRTGSSNTYAVDFTAVTGDSVVTSVEPVTTSREVVTPPSRGGDTRCQPGVTAVTSLVSRLSPELSSLTLLESSCESSPWAGRLINRSQVMTAKPKDPKAEAEWINHQHHFGMLDDQERDQQLARTQKKQQ